MATYASVERDPIVSFSNRATVPLGRGFRWQRFHLSETLVWVDDAEGIPRALTPKQYAVLVMALGMIDREMMTMRDMAARLSVAPSTVSRALTKLQAWGLIRVIVGRGRWAGLVILKAVKSDGFAGLRKAAKERIRRWYQASQRRLSRLAANVAPYLSEEGVRVSEIHNLVIDSKDATLTAQRKWTPEELRSVGIL